MIARVLCSVVLTVACAAAASAQTRFEGRLVHDASGEPVAGATVSIVGASGSAQTDRDGRFTWAPAPQVPFQVIVVRSGGEVAQPLIVSALQPGTTVIRIKAVLDEALTVLGAAPSINRAPAAAATVLSGTQIAQRNPENLMQALETVPGINQVSEGHASVPAVRGMARGRTLFLIDGARVAAERRVGPGGSFLDPAVIEGIDIARGPGTVAYGSDALGGVISVRTRQAVPGSPLKTRVTGTVGAGIPEARASVEVSKGFAQGGMLVQVHARNADDYDGPDATVFNSGWEDQGFLVNFQHTLARGLLSAALQSDFGRNFERPRNNSRAVRFYYPFENSHRFTSSYKLADVGGFRELAFSGFLGTYEQRTDQDRFPTATTGRGIERADVSANDFHVKGSAERLAGSTRLEFGLDVNGRYGLEALDIIQTYHPGGGLSSETTTVSVDDAQRTDTGIYAQAESALGAVARVSGGIRADRVTTRNVGGFFGNRSTSHAALSGFGALTIGPFRGFDVTAQLARGFRDPVLSDRYFRGPSGRGFITGDPDLDPETSLQFDLAARYTLARVQLAAYAYTYRIADLVERFSTQTDFFFFRNRGRARLRGFELEARSDLGSGYSIEIASAVARGRALDDTANLDDVSPPTFAVTGRKDFSTRGFAHARAAWHGEDTRPGPSEIAAPGATLLDVGGGWRIGPRLELRGNGRNLLNDTYYASPDPRFVLAPGRSASVTVVLQF